MDLNSKLREFMDRTARPWNPYLSPSQDLCGSLRHTQLRLAKAPTMESDVIGDFNMMIGTLVHDWLHKSYQGDVYIPEIEVEMPYKWRGTADALKWDKTQGKFQLHDYKTTKPEGLAYIPKDDHIWQASCYLWNLIDMTGLPIDDEVVIIGYIPKNPIPGKIIECVEKECVPVARNMVMTRMNRIRESVNEYLVSIPYEGVYHTDKLAPQLERTQKIKWDNTAKVFNVILTPHYLTSYCPYDTSICGCSEQRPEKIGHYKTDGTLIMRKGYDMVVDVRPTDADFKRRQ